MKTKIVHPELSYEITGICFKIHSELGRFCREKQYCDKFEEVLREKKIKFQREVELKEIADSSPMGNKADFVIESKIVVDFKAKKYIDREDYIQMQRYLQASGLELGLIINFRAPHLKPKRVLNISNYKKKNNSLDSDVIRNIRIALIAAIGQNRELGNSKINKLLWHIPEDFKHFKKLTLGHPVIMGRKTFESIGKPLPKRLNIIISRNHEYKAEECLVVSSISEAIDCASAEGAPSALGAGAPELFVIGGGQIFEEALAYADKLYLTLVHADFPQADVFFPDYSEFSKVVSKKEMDNGQYKFDFLELTRPLKSQATSSFVQ